MPDSNDIVYSQNLRNFAEGVYGFFGGDVPSISNYFDLISSVWTVLSVILLFFSAFFILAFIYATIRYNQLGELETDVFINEPIRLYKELYGGETKSNKWVDIQRHLDEDSPNEWRIAIIEADVMLDETLEGVGYAGASVGDKLKNASPETLKSLDDAWKAHRVRNQIAHAGADFVLTHKLARETILQYQRVFQEFGVV